MDSEKDTQLNHVIIGSSELTFNPGQVHPTEKLN